MKKYFKSLLLTAALLASFPCQSFADSENLILYADGSTANFDKYWYFDWDASNFSYPNPVAYLYSNVGSNSLYRDMWLKMLDKDSNGDKQLMILTFKSGGYGLFGNKDGYYLYLEKDKEYSFECEFLALYIEQIFNFGPKIQISIYNNGGFNKSAEYNLNYASISNGSYFHTNAHAHSHLIFKPDVSGNYYIKITNTSPTILSVAAVDMSLREASDKNRIRIYDSYLPTYDNDNCVFKKDASKPGTADKIVLTEGYDYYSSVDVVANEVNYERSLKNEEWQSVCLPYDVAPSIWSVNYDAIKLVSDEGNGNAAVFAYIDETETLAKHQPYLLRPKEDAIDKTNIVLNATNVTVGNASAESSTAGTLTLTGTYQETKMCGSEVESTRYALANGEFKYTTNENKTLKPFRAYLTENNASASALRNIPMKIEGENQDNETNGIDSAIADFEEGYFYDLSGKKVINPQTGVYIFNGKKILLKR